MKFYSDVISVMHVCHLTPLQRMKNSLMHNKNNAYDNVMFFTVCASMSIMGRALLWVSPVCTCITSGITPFNNIKPCFQNNCKFYQKCKRVKDI